MLSVDDEWASFLSQSQPTFSVSFANASSVSNVSKSNGHKNATSRTPEILRSIGVRGLPGDGLPSKSTETKNAPNPARCTNEGLHTGLLSKSPVASLPYKLLPKRIGIFTGNTKVLDEEDRDYEYELEEESVPEIAEPIETPSPTSSIARSYVPNELFISTKTKVLFLNQPIDINDVFWKIPVEEYWKPIECVVKKQMKIVSKSPEEYAQFMEKLKSVPYYTENIIKQINNPTARRIKFKDERKITVGISKKDIMNCRGKVKNAFYNCFAIIIRFKYEGEFREIHVKIFNTGKLEIPGVLNSEILEMMRQYVLKVLQPHISTPLAFIENSQDDNVLINSNFNCGFYIDREKLFSILRSNKYGLETAYDPCIYPGIKCKFYFNNTVGVDASLQTGRINTEDRNMKMSELGNNKTYTEVSFMIFRTGSCLIVGNCSETILQFIFQFIKNILIEERPVVAVANEDSSLKIKHPKLRKKSVNVSANYLSALAK